MRKLLAGTRAFIPLLLFYLVWVAWQGAPEPMGDGIRYYAGAEYLLQGQLADPVRPSLRNGPFYPLILTPVVGLELSIYVAYLLNVVFLMVGIIYLYRLLHFWVPQKWALVGAYALGLYPPLLMELAFIAYEPLMIGLMGGYLYHLFKSYRGGFQGRDPYYTLIYLGCLALTKLIFPYVILGIVGAAIPLSWLAGRKIGLKIAGMHLLALCFTIPYLIGTYQLTGKLFYWGEVGGEILYWKSSPHPGEHGNWLQFSKVARMSNIEGMDSCGLAALQSHHSPLFQSLLPLSPMERSERLNEVAKANISEHPTGFIKNTFASLSRLFFNFPFSYTPQKLSTTGFILSNLFFVCLGLISLVMVVLRGKLVPIYIWHIGLVTLLYLGGISLLNGRVRHLVPMIPIIIAFISYAFGQLIDIRWRQTPPHSTDSFTQANQ